MPHEVRLSWRSRLRIAVAVVVTFAIGVVAATTGAPWFVRVVAALLFVVGAAVVLDAVIFTSSWRMTASALEVPTLLGRRRQIGGRNDLTVELRAGAWSQLAVVGPAGTRLERINPLISGHDLRRWWDALPDR
jgi:hypothetical protein